MFTTIALLVLAQSSSVEFAAMLDLDGDGIIHPMEAADAIQMLMEKEGEGLPVNEVDDLVEDHRWYIEEEATYFVEEFDANGDGAIQFSEVPEDLLPLFKITDEDANNEVTVEEVMKVNPDTEEVFALVEIDEIFIDLDKDQDGKIELRVFEEDDEMYARLITPFDIDKDDSISKKELFDGYKTLDAPVLFSIQGDTAVMEGVIGVSTPFRVMELVYYHPEVKTIIMLDVPGSIDDDSSLRASRIVRKHGLNTHVPSDGEVASGGTDFFQAGVKRTCGNGAKFGVHSWAEFGAEGTDYPRNDEVHKMYLDYCDEMGIPQSFYWYTLKAAEATDIHYMTSDEITKFKILTTPIVE